jgi:hypothetical protein
LVSEDSVSAYFFSFNKDHPQLMPTPDNLRFRELNERTNNFHAGFRAQADSLRHGVYGFRAAIREDCMVSCLGGDDDGIRSDRSAKPAAVAERDDGLFHGGSFVVRVRNIHTVLQSRRAEVFADEIQTDEFVADTQPPAMSLNSVIGLLRFRFGDSGCRPG